MVVGATRTTVACQAPSWARLARRTSRRLQCGGRQERSGDAEVSSCAKAGYDERDMGQPSPRPHGSRTQPLSPLPRLALIAIAACFLVAVVNPVARGGLFGWVDVALKLGVALSAAIVATWAEERVYAAQSHGCPSRRLVVASTVPALSLLIGPPVVLVLGVCGVLVGDDGTLAVAALVGSLWFGSAGLGSLVVLVLDVAVSVVLPDLRTRFQVAVLGLLAVAVAAAVLVFRAGQVVATRIQELQPSEVPVDALPDSGLLALLAAPEATDLATALFFVCAVAIGLPAVLSACSKLAHLVMARLSPLQSAFRAVADGDFSTRVEEGGSRELRELGRSFNSMAESLIEAREEVQRLNEDLENEVAARTRELSATLGELQQAQTRLVETEKQVMLSRLTAGLLHEVNSPLGALRSATSTMRRSSEQIVGGLAPSPPQAPANLLRLARANVSLSEVVVESTRRIEELMDNLRRFVSLDAAERKIVDVREALETALALVEPVLGDHVRVSRDWPAVQALVSCFPARLNQAFLNLLQNAGQALSDVPTGTLSVTVSADDARVTVAIADNGCGMDEQQLRGVFGFGFARKEGGRVGLRLGLPSSKRWIEEIGGTIEVSSQSGVGTSVEAVLPRVMSFHDGGAG